MPFIILIKADEEVFLMGDTQGRIIGFSSAMQAIAYYDKFLTLDKQMMAPQLGHRNSFSAFHPSIVKMDEFRELVKRILRPKPVALRISTNSETRVGITTQMQAKVYWLDGRHSKLADLRKGGTVSKLKGREAEVIRLMQSGLGNLMISKKLGVHAQTVLAFIIDNDLEKYRHQKRCVEVKAKEIQEEF